MKKFYFLMVALCVAMAANAASSQLFLVGDPAGGWATNKGLEMTKTGEGVFEIKGEFGGTFAFSDILCASNNDWSTFNAHRYGAESKDMAVEPGKYKANYGWDNSWQIVKAEYTFTVDTNNGELTISTEQEIVKNVSYAIHGTILGDADWTSYDMTEDNGLWVLADVNLKEGDFGIKENTNGSQSAWYASSDNATVGAEGEYGAKIGGTNWHSTLEGAYTLTFDPVACKLTISSGTLKPRSIYLIGNIEGANWTTNQGGVLTEVEAGTNLYMGTVKMADSGNDYSYFNITTKLTVDNGDWDGLNAMGCRYMAPSEDADLQSNTVAEFIDGTDKGWSFKIIPGTHTFVIDLNAKKLCSILFPTSSPRQCTCTATSATFISTGANLL